MPQRGTKHVLKYLDNAENFAIYLYHKVRETNDELKNQRPLKDEEILEMYNTDLDFMEFVNLQYPIKKEKERERKSNEARKLHEKYGKDLLKRTIHSSECQSKKGIKGGNKNVETGWAYEAIKLATSKFKQLLEQDPAYRKMLSENGTKVITDLNTRIVKCPICEKEGPYSSWKKYHFDWCGKKRPKSKKELIHAKNFGEEGRKRLKQRMENVKKQYDDDFQIFYDKCPDIFTKKEAFEIIKNMGYKPNMGWFKRNDSLEKIAHGTYRKKDSNQLYTDPKELFFINTANVLDLDKIYTLKDIFIIIKCNDQREIRKYTGWFLYDKLALKYFKIDKSVYGKPAKFKKIETV